MGNDDRDEWRDDASLIVPPRRYAVPTRSVRIGTTARRTAATRGFFRVWGSLLLGGSFVRSFVRKTCVAGRRFVVVPPTVEHLLLLDRALEEIEIEETFVHHADAVFEHGGRGGGVLRETVLERRVGARFGVFPARTAELYHC